MPAHVPTMVGPEGVTVTVEQLKALSEPSRLRILTLLMDREMSISGVAKATALTPATVHHHIAMLVLGMLKGLIDASIRRIQEKGTVDFEVGRLFFYRVPWRRDVVQQVQEIFEETRRKLERLEAKAAASGEPGEEVMALLTTLPA